MTTIRKKFLDRIKKLYPHIENTINKDTSEGFMLLLKSANWEQEFKIDIEQIPGELKELNLEEESIIDFALGSLSRQIDNLDDANKGPKGF